MAGAALRLRPAFCALAMSRVNTLACASGGARRPVDVGFAPTEAKRRHAALIE